MANTGPVLVVTSPEEVEKKELEKKPSAEISTQTDSDDVPITESNQAAVQSTNKADVAPAKKHVFEFPKHIIPKKILDNSVEIIAKCLVSRAMSFRFVMPVSSPLALVAFKIREHHESTVENIVR